MRQQEAQAVVDALVEVLKPPFQVVQAVVEQRWTFPINHYPGEQQSDEEPPIRLGERAEVFPIDGLLGIYSAERQEITIFMRGIKDVATRLGLREQDVTIIVRLHEWAHALLHLGLPDTERVRVTRDEAVWPDTVAAATAWFDLQEVGLHERLAQLIVHHGLTSLRSAAVAPAAQNALDRVAAAFEKVTRHAPSEYQIEKYTSVSRRKVVTSIELLKFGGIVGLPAWDTVITW